MATLERVEYEGTRGRKQLAVSGQEPSTSWVRQLRYNMDGDDTEAALGTLIDSFDGTTITRFGKTLTCRISDGYRIADGRAIIIAFYSTLDSTVFTGPLPSPIGGGTPPTLHTVSHPACTSYSDGAAITDADGRPAFTQSVFLAQRYYEIVEVNDTDLGEALTHDGKTKGAFYTVGGQGNCMFLCVEPIAYKLTSSNYYMRKRYVYEYREWVGGALDGDTTNNPWKTFGYYTESGAWKISITGPSYSA